MKNMKFMIVCITILMIVTAGGFAQEWYRPDFRLSVGVSSGLATAMTNYSTILVADESLNGFAIPVGLFFDATYALFGIGLENFWSGTEEEYNYNYFTVGLLGKYPLTFGANRNIRVFPLVGFEWRIFLQNAAGDTRADFDDVGGDYKAVDVLDTFSILTGVGADFDIGKRFYFRVNALFETGIPTKYEFDLITDYDVTVTKTGFKSEVGFGFKF